MTTMEQEYETANKLKTNYTCDIIINAEPPYTLYCAKDIGNILNMTNIRNATATVNKIYIIKDTNGGSQKIAYITYESLIKLVTKSRKTEAIKLAETLNLNLLTKFCVAIETDVLQCILTTFDGNTMKLQYCVDKYNIDLYFPDYLLAIECDENHHNKSANKFNDTIRQNYITQKLGCRFIRFNPHNKNFNLFKLLNDIYIHLSVWQNYKQN